MFFKINKNNREARTGVITTAHGKIKTPAFVPVATKAAAKAITPKQLEEIDTQIMISNSFHLHFKPTDLVIKKFGGIHKFMNWPHPLMTDSGGFQVYSLNDSCKADDEGVEFRSPYDGRKVRFDAKKSMQIQQNIGADIIFAFDECLHVKTSRSYTESSMEKTHNWADKCLQYHKKKDQTLYGVAQGGFYKDLRKKSARFIGERFKGVGLGSFFGDPKTRSYELAKIQMNEIPVEKPKHMLGIGAVEDIFHYVEIGADTFDCVLPTRLGRSGYVFSSQKGLKEKYRYRITNAKYKLDKKPLEKGCQCYTCRNYSRGYIYHLFKANEMLAYTLTSMHNIYFFNNLMKQIRESIDKGTFQRLKTKWMKK